MSKLRIGPNSPFRRAFDGLDTYYDSKESFIVALYAALDAYNDSVENPEHAIDVIFPGMDGPEGYNTWTIRPKNTAHVTCECCEERIARAAYNNVLVVTHYEMRPGRYEFVVYVSI